MVRQRIKDDHDLALGFVRESTERVAQQKQLIARLKKGKQPTKQAEEILRGFEANLRALRNHWELMHELMGPSELEESRTPHGDARRLR
jgi:hypothetical protein